MSNADVAREYIRAIEGGATGEALARFYTPDVVFTEMPNRFMPKGSTSDLAKMLQRAEMGQRIMRSQTYRITKVIAEGDTVALEIDWTGITAVEIQGLPAGSEMRDHAAVFLDFREGLIARQRYYDCFEPW